MEPVNVKGWTTCVCSPAILDVFVKLNAKLIDVLVKKEMFYAIQSVTVYQIVKINNYE